MWMSAVEVVLSMVIQQIFLKTCTRDHMSYCALRVFILHPNLCVIFLAKWDGLSVFVAMSDKMVSSVRQSHNFLQICKMYHSSPHLAYDLVFYWFILLDRKIFQGVEISKSEKIQPDWPKVPQTLGKFLPARTESYLNQLLRRHFSPNFLSWGIFFGLKSKFMPILLKIALLFGLFFALMYDCWTVFKYWNTNQKSKSRFYCYEAYTFGVRLSEIIEQMSCRLILSSDPILRN